MQISLVILVAKSAFFILCFLFKHNIPFQTNNSSAILILDIHSLYTNVQQCDLVDSSPNIEYVCMLGIIFMEFNAPLHEVCLVKKH